MPAFLDVLQHVDRQLGRAQIGAGRFADQVSDDRLALGDLSALTVDGRAWGSRHPFRPARRGDTCRPLAKAKFRTIYRDHPISLIYELI
jgi:hypothetical protein